MNSNQLWETIVDAEQRTMLQVKAEDWTEAEGIFTFLMGDAVVPRCEFV
jgi:DNA gyrase subunit B